MRLPRWVNLLAIACVAFLYLPLAAVAFFSVNDSRFVAGWKGFTTRWYAALWEDRAIWEYTWNTLVLAVSSTIVSTILGTALGIAIERTPWSRRQALLLETAVQIPVITPDIIFAAALVVAFGVLRATVGGFEPGMATMMLGHVTFQVAFVAIVVRSRLATMGPALEEAGRDLYADGLSLFRRVTLPLVAPGVVAGAMLAFTLSLDDFVVSYFTAGAGSQTLPIYIFGALRRGIPPQVHAVSTLLILATVVLVLLTERLTRLRAGGSSEKG